MTRWQRFLAFFGLYTPPAPTELGSLNDLYTPNATTIAAMHEARSIHRAARPEKHLYAPKPTIRAKLPPAKQEPVKERDHTADVLLGAAAGYALGSLSHHESSYTPTPSPSYDNDTSSSSSDSGFSGGGGDFGGGGSSGDFGGGSSD